MSSNQQIYILGPCSAESREQVLETARLLKEECGSIPFIYRAGAWKPRTSPYTFQGAGSEALEWLAEAKSTFGIDVATEVATPEHVREALEAGIDYLWIGARTSANPIAVQEIATQIKNEKLEIKNSYPQRGTIISLKGILIKNPVNNDAGLWIGNIERLEKTGIPVMAVHRGCNHQPCWAMAHSVHVAKPEIPLLIDPSHMSGDAEKIAGLLQKARELGFDGAMVEVHHKPEEALSDAKQQIAPNLIREVLLGLPTNLQVISNLSPTSEELGWLRAEIDELDEQLWETIAARMDVSKRIGEWKKAHGIAPLQPERYQQIVEKLKMKNEKLKIGGSTLSEAFMMNVWELIHEESLRQQRKE